MQYAIDAITVVRASRQRREITADSIERMKLSLVEQGQISPVLVDEDGVLHAGETRYLAAKELGWSHLEVVVREGLTESDGKLIELAENLVRTDLPWQDQCAAVAEIHELLKANNPDHVADDTAHWLNIKSRGTVTRMLQIHNEIAEGNERITSASGIKAAANIIARSNARKKDSILAELDNPAPTFTHTSSDPLAPPVEGVHIPLELEDDKVSPTLPYLNADFLQWFPTYSGKKFNFLHCDFPYGVNADKQAQGAAAATYASYADTFEVYDKLLTGLAEAMPVIVAESAHMVFWFSMDYYTETKERLEAMGWSVSPFPLIWHKSDNKGMLPDPNRQPRRTYETAFFCTRGDRKLVGPVANSFGHPGGDKSIHMSEKPRIMLHHFFRMLVDEYTVMLDPTAGSGNAVKEVIEMGGEALGLEISGEIHETAVESW